MKQKQLSILAASLVAAFAANVASAGQISSSSVTLAREVIETNAQIVRAPAKSYTFAGDIDARNNAQRLQVQLRLPGTAKWGTTVGAGSVIMTDSIGATIAGITIQPYVATDSTGHSVLYANIDVPISVGLVRSPIITFNPGATVGTNNSGITNLLTVAGATGCRTVDTSADVDFKHYTTYSSPDLMTGANPDSEDQRANSTNTGRLVNFTDNLQFDFTKSTGTIGINNTTQTAFTGTAPAFVAANLVNLGTVKVTKFGQGRDLDYSTEYGSIPGAGFSSFPATATAVDGTVELKSLDANLTFAGGTGVGSVFLASDAACGTKVGPTVATTLGGTAYKISLTSAADVAQIVAAPLNVCYSADGVSILSSTTVAVKADLIKANLAGANGVQEQNNSCSSTLTGISSGSVKIDVRNYATTKTAGGWMSVIRVINPSETRTANVFGQLIHADGTYGGWGQIATLAPRAVVNLTSTEIDAKTTGTPATNGAGYVGGAAAPAAQSTGDRLRITADVSSLRVQNYLYNPDSKNFIEASSTQGVDFDSYVDRAPGEAQAVTQDAQRGLAK